MLALHWYDWLGNVGVLSIVVAYFLLQAKRLNSDSMEFLLANGFGSALILISLFYAFNWSAFLVEFFWLLISLYGLVKRKTSLASKAGTG